MKSLTIRTTLTTTLMLILALRAQAVDPVPDPTLSWPTTESKVAEACRLSPYKKECMAQFGADPKNQKAGMKELGVKALQHASQVAADTVVFLQNMLNSSPDQLGPMVEQYVNDCSEFYLDAVEQLDDCMAGMMSDAYADVQTWLNAAVSDANMCETEFRSQPMSEEIKTRNDQFLHVCENAKSVTKALGTPGKKLK